MNPISPATGARPIDFTLAASPPSTADRIRALTSYSLTDWSVSREEQRQVVELLRNDRQLDRTVRELAADANVFGASSLTAMLKRVDIPEFRREMVDLLARGVDDANAALLRRELNGIDLQVASGLGGAAGVGLADQLWQVRFNLVRAGMPTTGPGFDRGPLAGLVSNDPSAPFTGSGASGVNPTSGSMSLGDQLALLVEQSTGQRGPVTARYSNPIPGDLNAYLAGLTPADRARQAELFLRQPISSPMSEIWGPNPPSRAQVIEFAARRYNLDPATLAGFLLAEQRDQSRNEDLKDIASALNAGHNSSIGLGQVVISTARNHNLFSDAVSPEVMRVAGPYAMTRMLSDDALNILAAAKYIRQVADQGAALSMSRLEALTRTADAAAGRPYVPPTTRYPGLDLARYSGNSATWGNGNIAALGSEYTSRPWDGSWSPGWGQFVVEARNDVLASGVFR